MESEISTIYSEYNKYPQYIVNITKKKHTHKYREQTSGYQWREFQGWTIQVLGSGRYKLLDVR